MTYIVNGKKVSKEEFLSGTIGFDYNKGFSGEIGSFTPFISPIDGKWIVNNKQLSDHNRAHGVQQVGHEYEKRNRSE